MQVFIIGTPIETVKSLDLRRLRKQIIETKQILNTLAGKSQAWKNHPCVLQYRDYQIWLSYYLKCFEYYIENNYTLALSASLLATEHTPPFHTPEYFTQMKRRLFTKDQNYYKNWSDLGLSEINWYWVDNEWRYYKAGKRL